MGMELFTGDLSNVKALVLEKLKEMSDDQKVRVIFRRLNNSIYEAEFAEPERPPSVTMYWRSCENEIIIESTKRFIIKDVWELKEDWFRKTRCP